MGENPEEPSWFRFLRREGEAIFSSLAFFTILPLPGVAITRLPGLAALRYFPLAGWIVGGLSGLFWMLASSLELNRELTVLGMMILSTWLTGAMHEDGLADAFDGMGGGYTREDRLRIMKDSATGTYGVLALLFSRALIFVSLEILPGSFPAVLFVVVESVSRWSILPVVARIPYARVGENSKAGAVVGSTGLKTGSVIFAFVLAIVPSLMLLSPGMQVYLLLPVGLSVLYPYYFFKKIGGYTGDLLGAGVEMTKVVFLVVFSLTFRFLTDGIL